MLWQRFGKDWNLLANFPGMTIAEYLNENGVFISIKHKKETGPFFGKLLSKQ